MRSFFISLLANHTFEMMNHPVYLSSSLAGTVEDFKKKDLELTLLDVLVRGITLVTDLCIRAENDF